MLKGYQVIDVDGHVMEPETLWKTHLEPEFQQDQPTFQRGGKRLYKGEEASWKLAPIISEIFAKKSELYYKEYKDAGWSPESQVKAMDRMGIDVSFLYPTAGLYMWFFPNMEAPMATAVARAYNNWLHDFCQYEPKRLRPVAGIALNDPELAVMEVRRTSALGFKAVFVRPNLINGRTLGDPAYEPFWAECERLGVAVGVHEGAHARLNVAGADRFNTDFAIWCCSHPLEQMMAFLAVLDGGVLERHPKLKYGILEAGCGWLPYWLWRLDERWENVAPEVADNVKMKPSEYFRRQCWISVESDEPYIGDLVKHIGEDRILFASDYPHPDHKPELTDEMVAFEKTLGKRVLTKILLDNPRAFYGGV